MGSVWLVGWFDRSRVDKPGVQEVTMRKVAQAQAAHDVAAETCETAAQPIEQGSKRVSNSVRGVGSGLKVFISHCKRISGTEDKAIWIADVLDSSEVDVKAWFDLKIKPTCLFQDSRCLFQDSRCLFQDSPCLFQDSRCRFQDSRCIFQDSRCPLARQPSQKYWQPSLKYCQPSLKY